MRRADTSQFDCDILVSSGGVAGLSAAAVLGHAGFDVVCVDPAPPIMERDAEGADLRTTAILQPALGRAGGLWEAKKIAALAEAHGAQVAPHLYAGPVEWAANIHLATTCANTLMAETIETDFHAALIGNAMIVEGGHIRATDAPGLGIEVDEALARAHPYEGGGLHLEMQEAPPDLHGRTVFAGGAPRDET